MLILFELTNSNQIRHADACCGGACY